jgi:midasin
LRTSKPILVTGQGGSGKTFLVHQLASAVNALDTLVSIHLSGQTDAKLLIGTYTTADTPGSFEWRPGVLATAVREGRWVLVEDIDKAPTEVLSVLLPLIERGELDIPSRGEKIKAARGFRLITTARTSASNNQDVATVNLLGSRLWVRVNVEMPDVSELQTIVNSRYPLLHATSPSILNTYSAIQKLYREPSFFAISRTSLGRQISPRDLFKWCNRTNALFVSAGVTTGSEVMEDGLFDQMFNEAVDCFAGSLHTQDARRIVVNRIAEELQVPSQRVEMLMTGHIPSFKDSERSLTVGRAKLQKRKQTSSQKRRKTTLGTPKRPFATTNHALRLLEQVGVAVRLAEPVLLVGETGTGKTTVVQQLADILGYNLTAINLSQQTEAGDLLGGYKPVDVRSLAVPLKETFDELFEKTFSLKKNQRFLDVLNKNWSKQQWKRVIILWGQAVAMAENFFATPPKEPEEQPTETGEKKKKRKLDGMDRPALQASWTKFAADLSALERQSSQLSKSFAFSFVEGSLVKAARNGDWVLLDEINLAAADTLESISDLLKDGGGGSILLSEKGDVERIQAHPNFRVFACMNPATDVGKRDLPVGLRSRFTELYVQSPDAEFNNLLAVVKEYIGHLAIGDERVCADVAQLYLDAKQLAEAHKLVDGANQKPHFSMRTLTRTLSYVISIAGVYGLRRSLFEGFCMSFLTLLDRKSEATLIPVIDKYIFGASKNVRSLLNQIPKQPTDGLEYVQFKHYWMQKGPLVPEDQAHYIITPSVDRNLMNLVRACATRKFPVLIQGPTSAGKTSMIEYLAKKTGHKFVRINNHEHTDLQEYLGTYVSDNDGKLSFLEGVLVDALRKGHWIVLDELNLAPTDVLEALNRLLDDNRELLIPETQEVVRPHKDFMLFATQNPPGLYGGRKNLSRAFRNRFLELHFDDIPESELGEILKRRCQNIAPAYCEKIVKVYKELSLLRQSTRLFEQKNSFATLRDLFRWAQRDANGYQQLAEDGYMLLAERVRKDEEKLAVQKILEKEMRVTIDIQQLYTAERCPEYALYQAALQEKKGEVVWTKAMKRLFALVAHALRNNEPVLLVGETGCGKTTVCQMLAEAFSKKLIIVNAHQNTETGDIIGAQRPIRNRSEYQQLLAADLRGVLTQFAPEQGDVSEVELNDLLTIYLSRKDIHSQIPEDVKTRIELNRTRIKALFEWAEGPLIQAMTGADFFLLDEISLADDSVLERLNSVLESGRGILLAEKGPEEGEIVASDGFQFLATMNPGGDYGKKELSPALRNRFTEIWVPSMTDYEDVLQIVRSKLHPGVVRHAQGMVKYAQWFASTYGGGANAATISIRQVLAWARFVNLNQDKGAAFGLLHGAALVFFDGLGANPSAILTIAAEDLEGEKQRSITKLSELCGMDLSSLYTSTVVASADEKTMSIGPFGLEKKEGATPDISFSLEAPTTALNAMRVLRAMQLHKPILLEGSPGVGKTSLITALASASGNPLTRINLSDQTDLMDLFGSDVPVEGGASGEFAWRDAPFLRAMQRGDWVLLDEMNLASQSVLEGLNACLDHRGEVYISELDKTFSCHPSFMVFAAQNPHHQGGGRKGLPASFVNRFTVVYVDTLKMTDLGMIAGRLFNGMEEEMVTKLISFVVTLDRQLEQKRSFGVTGGPWEFNLRDTLRWMDMLSSPTGLLAFRDPEEFIDIVIRQRFRTPSDKAQVDKIFEEVFGYAPKQRHLFYQLNPTSLQIGHAVLPRRAVLQPTPTDGLTILKSQLPVMETLITCITQATPVILVGFSGSGKSSMIQLLAASAGAELKQLALNADVDTTDIVGGFEQVDLSRSISAFFLELREFLRYGVVDAIKNATPLNSEVLGLVTFLDDSRLQPTVDHLTVLLQQLQATVVANPAFANFVTKAAQLLKEAKKDTIARFEWVDGLLIKAIEAGHWLVLDNANLCSPSVLDRLNSLTERNGFLIVNEHSTESGDPKLVQPHPEFRLFITMDPKHGELSRAMRNRCVEVFVDGASAPTNSSDDETTATAAEDDKTRQLLANFTGSAPVNAENATFTTLQKFADASVEDETYPEVIKTALEHIPFNLASMLSRWDAHISNLLPEEKASYVNAAVRELVSFASHPAVASFSQALMAEVTKKLSLDEDFVSSQVFKDSLTIYHSNRLLIRYRQQFPFAIPHSSHPRLSSPCWLPSTKSPEASWLLKTPKKRFYRRVQRSNSPR